MSEPGRDARPFRRWAVGLAGLTVVVAGAALLAHRVAAGRREQAEQELVRARGEFLERTRSAAESARIAACRDALGRALAALGSGRPAAAREALAACAEPSRGIEWGLIDTIAAAADGAGPPAFADIDALRRSINDLDVSPDGGRLATADDDGRVRVYDLSTGERTLALSGHGSPVLGVSFSPDGRRLASCSGVVDGAGDDSVRVWDAASGEPLRLLSGHESAVCGVAFSPDGRRIASVSGGAFSRRDDSLRLWDADTGECLATCAGHEGLVSCVEFSPDGRLVATGSFDHTVRLWDAQSGRPVATLGGHESPVLCLAFSPDGRRLASGSGDPLRLGEHVVRIWDVGTRQPVTVLRGHRSGVFGLAWSPDGTRIASGSGNLSLPLIPDDPGDASIRIWDASDGTLLLTLPGPGLPGPAAPVWELAFAPDGSLLVSGGDDGAVRLWFSRPGDAARFGSR